MNNQTRTKNARATLREYLRITKREPDTLKTDIIDLVTDLCHLANRHDIDYASIVFCAREHFLAEHTQREANARQHGRSIKNPPLDYVRAQHEYDKHLPD
jgi:hypothetical protein